MTNIVFIIMYNFIEKLVTWCVVKALTNDEKHINGIAWQSMKLTCLNFTTEKVAQISHLYIHIVCKPKDSTLQPILLQVISTQSWGKKHRYMFVRKESI